MNFSKGLGTAAAIMGLLFSNSAISHAASVVVEWNELATRSRSGAGWRDVRSSGGAYVLALMHAAMRDAVDEAMHASADAVGPGPDPALAAAAAAHAVLVALLPHRAAACDALLQEHLARATVGADRVAAPALGRAHAEAWLATHGYAAAAAAREPGHDAAHGEPWCRGAPTFALKRADQFRATPPPVVDGQVRLHPRRPANANAILDRITADEAVSAFARQYWMEPADWLWNGVARRVASERAAGLQAEAGLFAMLNAAIADACLAAEESRAFYLFGTWVVSFTRPPPGMNGVVEVPGTMRVQASVPNYPHLRSVVSGAAATVLVAWLEGDTALPAIAAEGTSTDPHSGSIRIAIPSIAALGEACAFQPLRENLHEFESCRSGLEQGRKIARWFVARTKRAWRASRRHRPGRAGSGPVFARVLHDWLNRPASAPPPPFRAAA